VIYGHAHRHPIIVAAFELGLMAEASTRKPARFLESKDSDQRLSTVLADNLEELQMACSHGDESKSS
jgi:hypothetical protein